MQRSAHGRAAGWGRAAVAIAVAAGLLAGHPLPASAEPEPAPTASVSPPAAAPPATLPAPAPSVTTGAAQTPAGTTPASGGPAPGTPTPGTPAPGRSTPGTPTPDAPAPEAHVPDAPAPRATAPSAPAPDPAAADCGGVLALGTVASCAEITDGAVHRWTVTTTVDGERLAVGLHDTGAASLGSRLTGPDGAVVCYHLIPNESCTIPIAGTYTIVVEGHGTGSYELGADSRDAPADCPRLDPATFSFPLRPHAGTLAAGAAFACRTLDQPAGSVLRLAIGDGGADVRGTLEDAAGTSVCHLQDDRECTLQGPGPYRAFLTEMYGSATDYRFAVTRLSDPAGCAAIPLAAFGADATRAVRAEVARDDVLTCHQITARAGVHLVHFAGDTQYLYWRIVDAAGTELCSLSGGHRELCPLPADGRYSLLIVNRDGFGDDSRVFTVAVHPVGTAQGCAAALGTRWDVAAVTGRAEQPHQVDCRALDAAPGERVLLTGFDSGQSWITDDTGADICAATREWNEDGCRLPGTGPYRVITAPGLNQDDEPRGYTLAARRLSAPQGCETVAPGRYNTPAPAPTTNRCRLLTISTPGIYVLEAVDEEDNRAPGAVYHPDGRKYCDHLGECAFAGAGTYTLVVHDERPTTTVLLSRAGGEDCTPVSDRPTAAPHRIRLDSPGLYRCLLLPTPDGAGLTLLTPQDLQGSRPDIIVVDANGYRECGDDGLREGSCVLDGTAPFRVLAHRRDSEELRDVPVVFASPRHTGCASLPRTPFGAAPAATVTPAGAAFVSCWTVPAGQFAATELYGFRRTAGTGVAKLSVFDAQGSRRCLRRMGDAGVALCTATAGPLTVVLEGSTATGTFAMVRHDATGTAQGCRAVTSTVVGGPAVAGTSLPRGDVQCHRVTANALDQFLVDTRDGRRSTRLIITDQAGESAECSGWVTACPLRSGGTSYQLLVYDTAASGTTPYRLDVWKTSVAGRIPAECTAVPDNGYGFGPYTGTLSDARAGLCLTTTVRWIDDFDVEVLNLSRPDAGTDVDFHLWKASRRLAQMCGAGGDFDCRFQLDERSEPVLLMLSPGERVGPLPYRLQATCRTPLCGGHAFGATGVTPASTPLGGRRTVTVRGSTLHLKDTVQVSVAGRPALTATVTSVAADRRTLTAQVDLASVPAGRATVTVRSWHADAAPVRLVDAFTVTPPPLRTTRAPSITGTRAVGETVRAAVGTWTPTATSYTYQWSVNGAAVKGATGAAFAVPPAALGKRLTVTVTARRAGHPNGAATSAAATVGRGRAPKAGAAPKVTGTARVGRTVKATVGRWSPTATSYRYAWRLNNAAIRGATGASLRLTAAMRGKRLTVTVTAQRTGHTDGHATSAPVTVRP